MLLLLSVVSVKAQDVEQVVVVNGKKCIVHTVTENDTFYSLAKRYDVSLKQIVELNGDEDPEKLALGKTLYIPYNEKAHKRSTKDDIVNVEGLQKSLDGEFIVHTLAENDTLFSVAKSYKISLDQLRKDNPEAEPTKLKIGSTLLVRTSMVGYSSLKEIDKEIKMFEKEMEDGEKSAKPKTHTVVEGDTLYSLARRYKTTEQQIMALNGFESPSDLLIGMTIIVRGDETEPKQIPTEAEAKVEETPAEGHTVGIIVNPDSVFDFVTSGRLDEMLELERRIEEDTTAVVKKVRIPQFKKLEPGETLDVVVMLPMHRGGKAQPAFVDMYRGILLALSDLRNEGYAINVTMFDTEHSAIRLSEIAESEAVLNADLIIGPIWEDEVKMILPVAEQLNIPVINPIRDIDHNIVSSPILFQMRADGKYQYDKYADIFDGSYQINIVFGPTSNMEYAQEVLEATKHLPVRLLNAQIGRQAAFSLRNDDGTNGAAVGASSLVRGAGKKAIIIVADRDTHINIILTTIGDMAKSMRAGGSNDCFVIGDRDWDRRFTNVERDGFFTSGVSLLAPYNSKRTDNIPIKVFESRFMQTYGILPTSYACTGYDAAMLFCTKMFTGLDKYIVLERITPLATTYQFKFENGMFVNTEWVNIQYKRDFTVEYK